MNYNDKEFLNAFCITRESFFLLFDQLAATKAFSYGSSKKLQRPIAYQILVFLYHIGKQGKHGGSLDVGTFFGIAKGSVNNYVRRCMRALLELSDKVVSWPSKEE